MPTVSDLRSLRFSPQHARHLGHDIALGLTATGVASQATGYPITVNINQFTVVTGAGNSATLPLAITSANGLVLVRNDDSADTLFVFPGVGDSINAQAANASISVPAGGAVILYRTSTTTWVSVADTTSLYNLLITTIQNSTTTWGGTSGGSANAQTITLTPAITAYAAGQTFRFKPGFTNTGTTTINVNALGVKTIKRLNGNDVVAGDINTANVIEIVYDGTNFILQTMPLQDGTDIWGGTSGGSANAHTVSITGITAYATGMAIIFRPGFLNTAAATINLNSLGAKTIKRQSGADLIAADLQTTQIVSVRYDGTNFILVENQDILVLKNDVATYTITNSTTETTVFTYDIAANFLGTNRSIRLTNYGTYINNSGANKDLTIKVKLGGTTIYNTPITFGGFNISRTFRQNYEFCNQSSASAQAWAGTITITENANESIAGILRDISVHRSASASSTKDSTASLTLAVTLQHSAADANLSVNSFRSLLEFI